MKRAVIGAAVVLVALSVLVVASIGSAESAAPKVKLTASPTTCKVNASVKLTASVTAKDAPYEVRIYKKVDASWQQVATASKVSGGKYVAYVKARPKGTLQFKAGYVNSKGSVTAYSNVVAVKVTK
jgi:hypothetical protein